MKFTLLKKLKQGEKFKKLIHRNGSMYASKKVYMYDGYFKRDKVYLYSSIDYYDILEHFKSKTGDILVIIGG